MRAGRENDAFNLLYAHSLVDNHGPTETLEKIRWVPSLRRAALGIRWGIGVHYSGTKHVDGPEPIGGGVGGGGGGFGAPGGGGPGALPGPPGGALGGPGGPGAAGGRTGGGRGAGRRGGAGGLEPGLPGASGGGQKAQKTEPFKAPDDPRAQLTFYTGEWSTKLLGELQTRLGNGAYGDFLKDAQAQHQAPAPGGGGFGAPGGPGGPGGGFGAGGGPGGPGGGFGAGGGPGGAPALQGLGAGGPPGGAAIGGGGAAPGGFAGGPGGGPGGGGPGGGGPGGGGPGGGGPGGGFRGQAGFNALGSTKQLLAGVTMIGTEEKIGSLLEVARREGVDFIFVFHVDVKTAGAIVQNNTRLELLEVSSGRPIKEVPSTQSILNTRAEKEKDPVDREIRKIFAAIDAKVQMGDLPSTATPQKVEEFVEKILAEKHTNAMPVLAQLKYYYHKKLLSSDAFLQSCTKLIGEEKAKIVMTANEVQLLSALSNFLPKERPQGKRL